MILTLNFNIIKIGKVSNSDGNCPNNRTVKDVV